MASFISQNVGAGKENRAKKAMATGMLLGASIGVIISALAFFKGDLLASVFSGDKDVVACAADYLKGFSIEAVVTCILFSFIGYFNGHGLTLWVMCQGIAQTFLVRLPVSFIMSIQPDATLTMIGIAAPLATLFGIAINIIMFFVMRKRFEKPDRVLKG